MNHHHIPLATATALVAIARPAMAASTGVKLTSAIGEYLGYVGTGLIALGFGLFVLHNVVSGFQDYPDEDMQFKIFKTTRFMVLTGIAAAAGSVILQFF